MVKIAGKELMLVRQVLHLLNNAFPPTAIPVKMWKDGVLETTSSTPDPFFLAYKSENNWWFCVCNYRVWRESEEALKDCCALIQNETGIVTHSCHMHPVSMGWYKQLHKQKKVFLLGTVSWAKV